MTVAAPRPVSPSAPRRRWSRRFAALTGLFVVSACVSTGDPKPSDTSAVGGTMVIVQAAEPATLFPPRANATHEFAVIASIFDRLAEIGPELQSAGAAGFVPRLASSWTWGRDSMSIAFHMDSNIRWHDGAPVRAEDVRYSFHVYSSKIVSSDVRSTLGNIDSVSVSDSLTAVFWFKRRTPQQFLDATYGMFILPSHILSALPDSALANSAFGRAPVGTGRFRFSKWDAGTRMEIVSDTGNARGRAKLDRVIWTFVGDNGAAAVKLFAGEADFFEKLNPDNIPQLASSPDLKLVTYMPLRYNFLGFNTRARRAPPGPDAPPHPVLGDVRVRRAFAMAIDRAKIVRTAIDSLGMVVLAPAPRVLIPDTAALKQLPYDVAAAKTLLDSAGWMDSNNDGVRDRNGKPLEFEVLVVSVNPTAGKLAVLAQAALKEIGATLKIQTLDIPAIGPRVNAHDFDAYMGGFQTNPGLQGLRQTWVTGGSMNRASYSNPTFDALVDSALTVFDPRQSAAYFTRAFQDAINDAPAVWLYEEKQRIAVHTRIHPEGLRADGWYANLADWWVDPAKRIDRDKVGTGSGR